MPSMLAMLMMLPGTPRCTSACATRCVQSRTWVRLERIKVSQPFGAVSSNADANTPPALLTRTVGRPTCATVPVKAAST